ncbi:MAG: ThuA domain-containing protein [Bacteroidales bacterium]|nr:ThuA domain-containing protein [Bacteroidales bacterium]
MKNLIYIFLILALAANYGCSDRQPAKKNIVILVGPKSHPAGMHEYIKSARLLKAMLDHSPNTTGINTQLVYNGWPENPAILDSADLILAIADGRYGEETVNPLMANDDRIKIIQKQMDRGCGVMTFHYTTFAPDIYEEEILEWTGGYFDWQPGEKKGEWYSDYTYITDEVTFPNPGHPVCNGIESFTYEEEFYFNLRFRENDKRLVPIMDVPGLETGQELGKVVAWAVERKDGGRGFGTTIGHYYDNFEIEDYRKFVLNSIVWTAGMKVPENGIESTFYSDKEVTNMLFNAEIKGLILTGHHHPGHPWEETTPVIKTALEKDKRIHIDVSTNIYDLAQYTLKDYDFLVLNYCNWEDPEGLPDDAKEAFTSYLKDGGGLMIIHFANGAWHYSLPGAEESDWPEFRNICLRMWDHNAESMHDAYGSFTVNPTETDHFITEGISSFETIDELYYKQVGEKPIEPLLTALSKDTGKDEPLAWVNMYGEGRIFQTLLGHDAASFEAKEFHEILRRAAIWVSRKE